MAEKFCDVSYTDLEGFVHRVEVNADSLYEAAAAAFQKFKAHSCEPGTTTPLNIEVKGPTVTHTVTLRRVQEWTETSAKSPKDKVAKDRVKGMLS